MRITTRTLAGLTLMAGLASNQAVAQVKTEDVLARKPAQQNVNVTTPTGADLAGCKAEPVAWPKQGNSAPTGGVARCTHFLSIVDSNVHYQRFECPIRSDLLLFSVSSMYGWEDR